MKANKMKNFDLTPINEFISDTLYDSVYDLTHTLISKQVEDYICNSVHSPTWVLIRAAQVPIRLAFNEKY